MGVHDGFNVHGFEYVGYWEKNCDEYSSHYLMAWHAILSGLTTYRAPPVADQAGTATGNGAHLDI